MDPSGYILRGWCRFVIVALISPCPLPGNDSFLLDLELYNDLLDILDIPCFGHVFLVSLFTREPFRLRLLESILASTTLYFGDPSSRMLTLMVPLWLVRGFSRVSAKGYHNQCRILYAPFSHQASPYSLINGCTLNPCADPNHAHQTNMSSDISAFCFFCFNNPDRIRGILTLSVVSMSFRFSLTLAGYFLRLFGPRVCSDVDCLNAGCCNRCQLAIVEYIDVDCLNDLDYLNDLEAHIGGTVMVGAGVFKGFCKGLS